MLMGSEIIGSRITLQDEQQDESVIGLILDIPNNCLIGVLISRGGWQGGAKILLWEDINEVLSDSLIVEDCSPIIDVGKVIKAKQILERQDQLVGLQILTQDGQHLGKISDFYVEETGGDLEALIISSPSDEATVLVPILDALIIADGFAIATPEMVGASRRIETA